MTSQISAVLIILLSIGFSTNSTSSIELQTPSVEIGKSIYTSGIGDGDHKIMAVVSGREMPATVMACINCHGKCGQGISVQGNTIPKIEIEALSARYRLHNPQITKKAITTNLKKSITLGINHKKQEMRNMMPRYKMSIADMDHLLAYLYVLGKDQNCMK